MTPVPERRPRVLAMVLPAVVVALTAAVSEWLKWRDRPQGRANNSIVFSSARQYTRMYSEHNIFQNLKITHNILLFCFNIWAPQKSFFSKANKSCSHGSDQPQTCSKKKLIFLKRNVLEQEFIVDIINCLASGVYSLKTQCLFCNLHLSEEKLEDQKIIGLIFWDEMKQELDALKFVLFESKLPTVYKNTHLV